MEDPVGSPLDIIPNGTIHELDEDCEVVDAICGADNDLSDMLMCHEFDQLDEILCYSPERVRELSSAIMEAASNLDYEVLTFMSNHLLPKDVFCFVIFDKDLLDWFLNDEEEDIYSFFEDNEILDEHLEGFGTDDFDSVSDLLEYLNASEFLGDEELEDLKLRYCINEETIDGY